MSGVPSSVVGAGASLLLHLSVIALCAGGRGTTASAQAPTTWDRPPLQVTIMRQPPGPLPTAALAAGPPLPTAAPPAARPLPAAAPPAGRPLPAAALAAGRPGRGAPPVAAGRVIRRASTRQVASVSPPPPPLLRPPSARPSPRPSPPPLHQPLASASTLRLAVAPLPDRPVRLPPDEARALRHHDVYPSLPETARRPGTRLQVMVDLCVSRQGTVDRMTFDPGASEALIHLLRPAILQWRYHPLRREGVATPFCHLVRLEYRIP